MSFIWSGTYCCLQSSSCPCPSVTARQEHSDEDIPVLTHTLRLPRTWCIYRLPPRRPITAPTLSETSSRQRRTSRSAGRIREGRGRGRRPGRDRINNHHRGITRTHERMHVAGWFKPRILPLSSLGRSLVLSASSPIRPPCSEEDTCFREQRGGGVVLRMCGAVRAQGVTTCVRRAYFPQKHDDDGGSSLSSLVVLVSS